MPDTAVVEAEVPASPEGEQQAQGGGEQVQPKEVSALATELKDMTPEEAVAFLDALPDATREKVVGELERRGEQRVQTRERETEEANAGMSAAFDGLIATGTQADNQLHGYLQWLNQSRNSMDFDSLAQLDVTAIASMAEAYKNGGMAWVGKQFDARVQAIEKKYADDLGKLSPDEKKRLDEARWRDSRNYTVDRLDVMIDILLDRRETRGREDGITKGKTAVKPELVDRIVAAKGALGQLAGHVRAGGSPVSRDIQSEIAAIDPYKPGAMQEIQDLRAKINKKG